MELALTPPENLGEARHPLAGVEQHGESDDEVDYFATSLPELLLFDWPRSDS
jgi:hypothetical protein